MITPGLVSVTFRKLSPAEIVGLMRQAHLQAIEWGGDIHVPAGDRTGARDVRRRTEDAGLTTVAYGSYYRVGISERDGLSFQSVLDTAVALGAPLIRVWAGTRSPGDADEAYWRTIVDESRAIADCAASAGVVVAFEYHAGTLTETPATALRLLNEVHHHNVRSLWQPSAGNSIEENLQALRQLLPHLANVHVFHWRAGAERRPLAEGTANWRQYLKPLVGSGRDHCALIEFVRNDEPAAFLEDAAILRGWLDSSEQI